jgi:periplasmic divalent cation tolerance protein
MAEQRAPRARRRAPRRRAPRATRGRRDPRRAPRAVVILSAYPSRASAERAARELVRSRFVACATVTPTGRAFYRWEGKERADSSALLWGKTAASRARAAVLAIRESHPDRVPEILVLPVEGGHAPYLAWIEEEVGRR